MGVNSQLYILRILGYFYCLW